MGKVVLSENDIYKGDLILINPSNLLKTEIVDDTLEGFNEEYQDIKFNKKANKILQFVLNEIGAGGKIVPVSGYRSLDEQVQIFNDSIRDNGLEFTEKYVALPNASEHQTGLAIDLGLNEGEIDFIRPSFPHSGICDEFRKVARKYGFIERYKEEKTSITSISAEEWHFRYVGYPHSEIIDEKNFCLEEYVDYIRNNKVTFGDYEISFIPYKGERLELELGYKDSVSGNNVDGFIITRYLK